MSTRDDHALIEETGVMGRVKALLFMGILLGLVFATGGGSFGHSTAEASAPTLVTRSVAATGSARAGARIVFSCGGEVCVMNADGTGRRTLTRHPAYHLEPSWSPDGQRIAFASNRDRNSDSLDVYVMNANGGDQRRVTRTKGGDSSIDPAWSPDGRRIAFARNDGLYVVNADGSGLRKLTSDGTTPAWSPDGRRIAFTSRRDGDYEVYVMNADGTGQRNLTRNAADDQVHVGGWSPDGRRIVFHSNRGGNRDIYVMNADGSGQRNLTRNPAADLFAAWSPDATQIAFTKRVGLGNPEIYVMNADGSGQRNLTRNLGGAAPAWSPLPRS
jgi:Tol biopolymer transport system component